MFAVFMNNTLADLQCQPSHGRLYGNRWAYVKGDTNKCDACRGRFTLIATEVAVSCDVCGVYENRQHFRCIRTCGEYCSFAICWKCCESPRWLLPDKDSDTQTTVGLSSPLRLQHVEDRNGEVIWLLSRELPYDSLKKQKYWSYVGINIIATRFLVVRKSVVQQNMASNLMAEAKLMWILRPYNVQYSSHTCHPQKYKTLYLQKFTTQWKHRQIEYPLNFPEQSEVLVSHCGPINFNGFMIWNGLFPQI